MIIGMRGTFAFVATLVALGLGPAASVCGQIQWANSIEEARQTAAATNKLVLVHFGANYCGPCRSLEQFVFSDPMVAHQMNAHFVPVKIDIQAQPELAEKYAIARIPHDVILAPDGEPVFRRLSPNSASNYRAMLQAGQKLALATTPQAQRVAEKISGMTQAEWEERVRSPFYGEEAARAGSLAGPVATLPAVPQSNGNLPAASVRQTAARVPELFQAGPPGQNQFPQHELVERPFPAAESTLRHSLPEIQAGGFSATNGRSGEVFPMSPGRSNPDTAVAASARPSAGLPGEARPNTRSQVTENSFFKSNASGPVVTADYRGLGHEESRPRADRVATTMGQDGNQAQPAAAHFVAPPAPPVGLEGYCPVSLLNDQQWVKGDSAFGCHHRGVLYLFASAEAQAKFMEIPDRLSPLLGGFDPVIFDRERTFQPGKRRFGVFCEVQPGQSAIVLFHSEDSREAFKQDSGRYLRLIEEMTKKADLSSRP